MVMMPGTLTEENEATYDQLISLIENSQDRLALIIVGCDDRGVRDRVVERYEAEAKVAQIRSYRIVLGENLSLRSGLARLAETEADLREGKAAVFTVTGADLLMRVKSDPEMEQSELDAFFGYLQWTREGLREFRYPVVLWVSLRILQEMGRRAPDFWSWRKAVLRFGQEDQRLVMARQELPMRLDDTDDDDEFLPPLEELLAEVEELEKTSPDSQGLPTLYAKLGQVYARRIRRGEAKDLEVEQDEAVKWFERAIEKMQHQGSESPFIAVFKQYGSLLDDQSQFTKAAQAYENSLTLAKKYKDKRAEAKALNGLGVLQRTLGNYSKAIDFHIQSLEIEQIIGDKKGISRSLNNLGGIYRCLGDYSRAIDYHNQALEIGECIGNQKVISMSLAGLGSVYQLVGDDSRAIDFYNQSFKLYQAAGDKRGVAASLGGIGNVYYSRKAYRKAIEFYTQWNEVAQLFGGQVDIANAVCGLGNAYFALGKYYKSVEFYTQCNEISQLIGYREGMGRALGGLGYAYQSLGNYHKAIDFHTKALKLSQTVSDSIGEASWLSNMAFAQAKIGDHWTAKQNLEKVKAIYTELKLEHKILECNRAIFECSKILAETPIKSPRIGNVEPPSNPYHVPQYPTKRAQSHSTNNSISIWMWLLIGGIALVLLIAWLLR
jgi:tetratricopeptide (TPR) repeat protein